MRSYAFNTGVMASIAAFGLNEVARLTLRSRKYDFRLLAPTSKCYRLYGFNFNRLLSFYEYSYLQA